MRPALLAMVAALAAFVPAAPVSAQFDVPFADPGAFDSPSFPQQVPVLPDVAPTYNQPDAGPTVYQLPAIPKVGNNPLVYCNIYGLGDGRCPLSASVSPTDPTLPAWPDVQSIPADRIAIHNPQAGAVSLLLIAAGNLETVTIGANALATRLVDPDASLEARLASGGRELAFILIPGVDYEIRLYIGSYFVVPVR